MKTSISRLVKVAVREAGLSEKHRGMTASLHNDIVQIAHTVVKQALAEERAEVAAQAAEDRKVTHYSNVQQINDLLDDIHT